MGLLWLLVSMGRLVLILRLANYRVEKQEEIVGLEEKCDGGKGGEKDGGAE